MMEHRPLAAAAAGDFYRGECVVSRKQTIPRPVAVVVVAVALIVGWIYGFIRS